MTETLPPPPEWVRERVLGLVGLRDLDMTDVLHVDIARSVYELGSGASDGAVLQRIRWHLAWHLRDAGTEFATSKTDYEHHVDRAAVKARVEGEKSGEMAVRIANASDEAYELLLRYRLAEQRERGMRKLLDSVQSAIDLHRSDRADERAADRAHTHGYSGGA